MIEDWDGISDYRLSIVSELVPVKGRDDRQYHILVEAPDEELYVTECGNGKPRDGLWYVHSEPEIKLGQLCRECVAGLGRRAIGRTP